MQCNAKSSGGFTMASRPHLRMQGLENALADDSPFWWICSPARKCSQGLQPTQFITTVIIGRQQFIASHNWSKTFIMNQDGPGWVMIAKKKPIVGKIWPGTFYHEQQLIMRERFQKKKRILSFGRWKSADIFLSFSLFLLVLFSQKSSFLLVFEWGFSFLEPFPESKFYL